MILEVYALSNVGKKRTVNQDSFFCNGICANPDDNDFRYSREINTETPALYGVFDGMGGHIRGEIASQIAVEETKKLFKTYGSSSQENLLDQICVSANERICDEMKNRVKGRMGSTVSMLLFENNRYFLCNLGDSPVFLIRDNKIRMISEEHTEKRNYEEVFGKNYVQNKKFRLTQHLGIFRDELKISPYHNSGTMQSDDIFVLCSDGLTDMASKTEILEIVRSNNSMKDAAEALLTLALYRGGTDNVTVIVCKACV